MKKRALAMVGLLAVAGCLAQPNPGAPDAEEEAKH